MATFKALMSEPFQGTPAELFGIASDPDLLAVWNKAIDGIEASERAAASEDAAICSHCSH